MKHDTLRDEGRKSRKQALLSTALSSALCCSLHAHIPSVHLADSVPIGNETRYMHVSSSIFYSFGKVVFWFPCYKIIIYFKLFVAYLTKQPVMHGCV
jgi:hypothetical protein